MSASFEKGFGEKGFGDKSSGGTVISISSGDSELQASQTAVANRLPRFDSEELIAFISASKQMERSISQERMNAARLRHDLSELQEKLQKTQEYGEARLRETLNREDALKRTLGELQNRSKEIIQHLSLREKRLSLDLERAQEASKAEQERHERTESELQKSLNGVTEERNKIQIELELARSSVEFMSIRSKDLESRLKSAQEALGRLQREAQQKLGEARVEMNKLKSELAHYRAHWGDLLQSERKSHALGAEAAALSNENGELRRRVSRLEDQSKAVSEALIGERRQLAAAERSVQTERAAREGLDARLTDLLRERDQALEAKRHAEEVQIKAAEALGIAKKNLQLAHAENAESHSRFEIQVSQANERSQKLEIRIHEMESVIRDLQASGGKGGQAIQAELDRLEAVQEQVSRMGSALQEQENRRKSAAIELKRTQAENGRLRREYPLRHLLANKEAELRLAKTELEMLGKTDPRRQRADEALAFLTEQRDQLQVLVNAEEK